MSRSGIFRSENLGQNAIAMIRNLCFALCVTGVLIFIVMAATYEPDDPMFHPSDATFKSDNSVVKTGEDFVRPSINGAAIEKFKDRDFYRFGKPVRWINDSSCHMAWRFRPEEGKTTAFDTDYRNFVVVKENCTLCVVGIGDYYSGVNAMRSKRKGKDMEKGILEMIGETVNDLLPMVELD
ncbi:Hypothetical predicted protein [Olea europaea subsp. europaea]|uniref:DUF7074 domain-containing protein n=1 Tax=Olea europaea subsp. europaea TaxID=158383 RepID=A0A8S0SS86_OLEEU|nr:Hypothetical predicted protein [Olea europaea subsp. europaea]